MSTSVASWTGWNGGGAIAARGAPVSNRPDDVVLIEVRAIAFQPLLFINKRLVGGGTRSLELFNFLRGGVQFHPIVADALDQLQRLGPRDAVLASEIFHIAAFAAGGLSPIRRAK